MKPTFELEREHEDIMVILHAMRKIATEMNEKKNIDLSLIGQVLDFLRTYVDLCHHEKEEKILYPILLDYEIPQIEEIINCLVKDHLSALQDINDMSNKLALYLQGETGNLADLSSLMTKFAITEESHINHENYVLLPWIDKVLNPNIQEDISTGFNLVQKQAVSHSQCEEYFLLLSTLYIEKRQVPVIEFCY